MILVIQCFALSHFGSKWLPLHIGHRWLVVFFYLKGLSTALSSMSPGLCAELEGLEKHNDASCIASVSLDYLTKIHECAHYMDV